MERIYPAHFFKALGLLGIVLVMVSCKHEPFAIAPDPTLPGDTITNDTNNNNPNTKPCDPDSVYFETDVLPILISNCAIATCHDASSRQDGVELTSYQAVLNSDIIKIGDPRDSDIYEVITENDPDDVMPPPPRAKLSAEQTALILKWIQQGAKDLSCEETGECDITNVTYSATVAPILQTHCTGCHSGGSPSGGISLATHTNVATVAGNGKLYGAISHQVGFKAMPQGGNKLPACEIDQIKTWIDIGAPNN